MMTETLLNQILKKFIQRLKNPNCQNSGRSDLDYNKLPDKIKKSNLLDIFILISACLIAGFLIKIPDIFNVRLAEIFYEKNAGIIVFFGLTLYIVWTNKVFELKSLYLSLLLF